MRDRDGSAAGSRKPRKAVPRAAPGHRAPRGRPSAEPASRACGSGRHAARRRHPPRRSTGPMVHLAARDGGRASAACAASAHRAGPRSSGRCPAGSRDSGRSGSCPCRVGPTAARRVAARGPALPPAQVPASGRRWLRARRSRVRHRRSRPPRSPRGPPGSPRAIRRRSRSCEPTRPPAISTSSCRSIPLVHALSLAVSSRLGAWPDSRGPPARGAVEAVAWRLLPLLRLCAGLYRRRVGRWYFSRNRRQSSTWMRYVLREPVR